MPNFMYQKKFHGNYYMSLLLFVPTYLFLYVHVNFYFKVHQGRVRSDLSLVIFRFFPCNYL